LGEYPSSALWFVLHHSCVGWILSSIVTCLSYTSICLLLISYIEVSFTKRRRRGLIISFSQNSQVGKNREPGHYRRAPLLLPLLHLLQQSLDFTRSACRKTVEMIEGEQDLRADTLDKDLEIQSLHSHFWSAIHDENGVGEGGEKGQGRTMTERDDVKANSANRCEMNGGVDVGGGKGGVMKSILTRMSTKSSWKDPGPPPDGGWSGWTQGS
jgi:hypothetical protein